ncbi:MAG TPA: thiamine phosphate synthase [Candidatus Krumholzibacteria bacterium]|nr:thiamine phosphate synthase [Candidatus Krumholzibacteria bacterium]
MVTDRTQAAPRTLASVVHDACASGVRAVQLREKDLSETDLVSAATRLSGLLKPRGAKLFVNASPFVDRDTAALLAASPGVDGFHIPDDPALLAEFREQFPKLLIGASAHTVEGVRHAFGAGANFVTFGPIFETRKRAQPHGLDALRAACAAAAGPIFAIGGITPERARECLDAGAHGVAVVSAVMAASSARSAVRAFAESMGSL